MKNTTEEFMKKALKIHNNKYDYSKVNYINSSTKVVITCPEHGDFEQTPNNHLYNKSGCIKCGFNTTGYKLRLTMKKFLKKAKSIHGNMYNYQKVKYINAHTKITITCPEHGDFEQIPNSHLNGSGCYYCGNKAISKSLKSNKYDFIQKAIAVHSDKYDYSKVNYINNRSKVTIICSLHGKFEQIPNSHLRGCGCFKCKSSKGELLIEEIFKKHNIKYEPQYRLPEIISNYEIDFYLPKYRLLIEFHGIQHYEYIPFFHDGDYTFEDQKRRDEMVRDAAIRFKYKYLEFNYKQLKHMTEEQFEQMVLNKLNTQSQNS